MAAGGSVGAVPSFTLAIIRGTSELVWIERREMVGCSLAITLNISSAKARPIEGTPVKSKRIVLNSSSLETIEVGTLESNRESFKGVNMV